MLFNPTLSEFHLIITAEFNKQTTIEITIQEQREKGERTTVFLLFSKGRNRDFIARGGQRI